MRPSAARSLRGLIDETWVKSEYDMSRRQYLRALRPRTRGAIDLDPNGIFDSAWYRREYRVAADVAAVVHYVESGVERGAKPSRWFDPAVYRGSGAPVANSAEPLTHFLRKGRHLGWLPVLPSHDVVTDIFALERLAPLADCLKRIIETHAMLDVDWYAWRHSFDTVAEAEDHYWTVGIAKLEAPNPYLDPTWYLDNNADVASAGWDPVLHYLTEGWNQGRDPSPRLSLDWFWKHHERVEPIKAMAAAKSRSEFDGSVVPRYSNAAEHRINDLQLRQYFSDRDLTGPVTEWNPERMNIHWVVPDFGPGSGGHTNIFRFARMLNERGHHNTIWLDRPRNHDWGDDLAADLAAWYGTTDTPIDFLPAEPVIQEIEGDAVIATGWQTTFPARAMPKFRRRFCLVQDYESMFAPRGSVYFASQATYEFDFDSFCASPWLQQLMRDKHHRWADMFWLAPNREIYYPPAEAPENDVPVIAAYARDHTTRRCVELLEGALTQVARRGVAVRVEGFGLSEAARSRWRRLGVQTTSHAYLEPELVGDLYRRSDLGIALSGTNYSSVPPDMMACGLPVLDILTEATSTTYAPGVVALAEPKPAAIADAICELLADAESRQALAAAGKSWIEGFSWDDGADVIESGLRSRIDHAGIVTPVESTTLADDQPATHAPRIVTKPAPLVSVVIPTYNGGAMFEQVARRVLEQETDFEFELYVIDSSSSDRTAEFAATLDCTVEVIDQSDFQHGRTRNYAIERVQGAFIAMLTQDALPVTSGWLQAIIEPMLSNQDVAGVFGRHQAHEGASSFTVEELDRHFTGFLDHPLVVNRRVDQERYLSGDPGWRQLLYYYSDNNSAMRRSVWRTLPYPAIPFGEDQAWAQLIIDAGWSKAYAPDALVAHSHDYDIDEMRFRASEEALFFRDWFGLESIGHPSTLEARTEEAVRMIGEIAERIGATDKERDFQCHVVEAKLEGWLCGSHGFLTRRHS